MKTILQKDLWSISSFLENKNYSFDKNQILKSLSKNDIDQAYSSISNWKGYLPTPLIELNKLSEQNTKFDLVVIDPPSFAKSAAEVDKAIAAYRKLAGLGLEVVSKNGILVLASCSSRVTAEVFFELIEDVMRKRGVSYSILNKTTHDTDHPIGFKEGAYLKCIYLQLN